MTSAEGTHLAQYIQGQEDADGGRCGVPQQVLGAAVQVQGERQAAEAHANDIIGLQRLASVLVRAEHNLGDPEAEDAKHDVLHPPAQGHQGRFEQVLQSSSHTQGYAPMPQEAGKRLCCSLTTQVHEAQANTSIC